MEQELFSVGIIGGGPAGCACAYFINKFYPNIRVSIIDKNPMKTILATGGGRCNIANAEYDFKELAKNYPRGEKFLYSIFSKFATSETLVFFDEIGIETFCQNDGRIFPKSESAKEVYEKFINKINVNFIKENALRIEQTDFEFKVITDMNAYYFDNLIYATGGHSGYDMIKRLGINVIDPKPSLVGLVAKNKYIELMGVKIEDVYNIQTGLSGDFLFTHFGISGPLVYKISSLYARKEMPYNLNFNFVRDLEDFQNILNNNPHKFIKNILSEFIPLALAEVMLKNLNIDPNLKAHKINGKMRDSILAKLTNFEMEIVSTKKDGETVTSGGVDLDSINPKTMESKDIPHLYFCGEVIDVDGFCGGFNLQNCWSTAYICAKAIANYA